jgi:flavin-binding protein dodecin
MEKVFKIIELAGTSKVSFDDATQSAIKQAAETVKGMSWFEVVEMRGGIKDGKIDEYQVILKVGFRVLD